MKTDAEITELLRKIREEQFHWQMERYGQPGGRETKPDLELDLEAERACLRERGKTQGRDYDVDSLDSISRRLDISYEKLRNMEAVDVSTLIGFLFENDDEFVKEAREEMMSHPDWAQMANDYDADIKKMGIVKALEVWKERRRKRGKTQFPAVPPLPPTSR